MTNEINVPVVGNLTADPELRYTPAGLALATFTIAQTPRHFNRQTNEWKDGEPVFLRCVVWREFAEHIAGSLTKGSRVVGQGVLQVRNWETPEGEKRSGMELKIEALGPDLRYATASVTRAPRQGGDRWNDQAASAAADTWETTPAGGAFDVNDPTPF